MYRQTAIALVLLFTLVARGRTSVEHEMSSVSGEDAVLRCLASAKPGVQYRSVRWYKVSDSPSDKLTGLVMKKLTNSNSTVQKFKGFKREVELLEDSQSLVLVNVTLHDAGRYRCFLAAPLGHQNQEAEVHLKVYESLEESSRNSAEEDTMYVIVAITLLTVALLMLYVSYVCLKNTLKNYKNKFITDPRLRMTHQMKHLIVNLESNRIVTKTVPQEYV